MKKIIVFLLMSFEMFYAQNLVNASFSNHLDYTVDLESKITLDSNILNKNYFENSSLVVEDVNLFTVDHVFNVQQSIEDYDLGLNNSINIFDPNNNILSGDRGVEINPFNIGKKMSFENFKIQYNRNQLQNLLPRIPGQDFIFCPNQQ